VLPSVKVSKVEEVLVSSIVLMDLTVALDETTDSSGSACLVGEFTFNSDVSIHYCNFTLIET
jgi:hypothetical protein